MNQLYLEPGRNILVGRPAKPLPRRAVKSISAALSDVEEVQEAHLPEVLVIGTGRPAVQVLFIVIDPGTAIGDVTERLAEQLGPMLRKHSLKIWPVGSMHEIIETVREADCLVGWRT